MQGFDLASLSPSGCEVSGSGLSGSTGSRRVLWTTLHRGNPKKPSTRAASVVDRTAAPDQKSGWRTCQSNITVLLRPDAGPHQMQPGQSGPSKVLWLEAKKTLPEASFELSFWSPNKKSDIITKIKYSLHFVLKLNNKSRNFIFFRSLLPATLLWALCTVSAGVVCMCALSVRN